MIDLQKFVVDYGLTNFPVGLSGCKASALGYDSCDFDIVVFDEKPAAYSIMYFENSLVHLHHGSLHETRSEVLIQYDQMQIIHDDSWDLRMFLSKIKETRHVLFNDYAKNCLIDSMFCSEKCLSGINSKNVFAPCWQKCATFYLADAICALNLKRPSPSHMLDMIRHFEKTPINQQISTVTGTIGIERATSSLLQRMLKSTIGFSEQIEENNHYESIQKKYDLFTKNSMLSDCYFYLGYVTKENFMKIKDIINRNPDLIHILKIAFDIESDCYLLRQQSKLTQKSCQDILNFTL